MEIQLTSFQKKICHLFVALLSFTIYLNGIDNEYSIDDSYVTDGNPKVLRGIEGIPEIFTSYYASSGDKQYEYRPIVQTTFAVEKSMFGNLPDSQTIEDKEIDNKLTQANVSHIINIALYALTSVLLLYFLSLVCSGYSFLLPLIITVLFVVHPLHTEPVNNLKSRDELLMLLFVLATLIQWVKYVYHRKRKQIFIATIFTLLAFLSKMSAIALFGLIPVILYFIKSKNSQIYVAWGVTAIVFSGVLVIRELLPGEPSRTFLFFENPLFIEDSLSRRIPLALYSAFHYLQHLIYPEHLSFYYGYDQIPMANFRYWQVWISALLFIPLGIYGLIRWWKRDLLGLAVVLWLGAMLAAVNLIYPLVGIVADRFTYVFSIGFCMLLGVLLWRGFSFLSGGLKGAKIYISKKKATLIVTVIFLLIVSVYVQRTWARNQNWENRITLFKNDIQHLDRSVRAHTFLADDLYRLLPSLVQTSGGTDYIQEVEDLYLKAIRIDSSQSNSYNNLGAINYQYYKDYEQAIIFFEKANQLDSENTNIHLNLAYCYGGLKDYNRSLNALKRVLEIEPNNNLAYDYSIALSKNKDNRALLQRFYSEIPNINAAIPKQKKYWLTVAEFYFNSARLNVAADSYAKAFLLDRNDIRLGDYVISLYLQLNDKEKMDYFSKLLNP